MKKNKILKLIIVFLIVYLLLIPVTITIQKNDTIKIYSTGFTKIFTFDYETENFKEKNFIFYTQEKIKPINIINIKNSFLRLQYGEKIIQKQKNINSALFIYNSKYDMKSNKNFYTNKKWIYDEIPLIENFYSYLPKFKDNIYILYQPFKRSFNIMPNIYIVNSKKDIYHELTHYYFPGIVKKSSLNDEWPEIIAESVSLLKLKQFDEMAYNNEINLKTLNFYVEPYGKKTLNFLELMNYSKNKTFNFLNYILNNYNKLNDEEFYQIIIRGDF
ncbi:hypothetical protein OF820_00775 [Oceanotoga sp. DSM 15011]|uniref:Uncharacterized protein n=1 Tax=Oceanotoga teriensis TaxID=515440 RepID=A0AA45C961_9BACT|nr:MULTISPECIES: hypothetical protein [Oceanotoga]MDO7977133.1 hypothetical protein [Oceanotoga teriensis]PWJ96596.1 hypothetical protein C7380_101170 [Oceanotoga teriensis]UYP00231.1 hypothetical protein OF820_00775 [Oceanotoga sp. DSM 15011]